MATKELYKPGVKVFYVHPEKGWSIGVLEEFGEKVCKVKDDDVHKVKREEVHIHTEGSYDKSCDDLFHMGDLHASTLLYCLKARYEESGMMFTRMGEIIISINPFQKKDYNAMERMDPHVKGHWECPHTWEVAHKAYKKVMVMDRGNQSILVSGESGAGKTETAKTLIDYLGKMSSQFSSNEVQRTVAEGVNKKLKASNPILESFGNAKTSRNDNSSRFGKYIKLFFDKQSGILIGAEMVHYLLEKSRIVTQNEGERGYHVFYEILAGFTDEQKKKYGNLTKSTDYACLSKGNQPLRELNGYITDDSVMYKHLMQAFKDTNISDEEQDQIFRVLGAILNLQNVKYETDESSGKAKVANPELVTTVAELLRVDEAKFKEALLVKARTKIMTQMADVGEAQDMRDALSKALYSGVFDWLVEKLNIVIAPEKKNMPKEVRYIGLLDIFGFENFKINSFEQFCINYTNETLQNHYNKYTFDMDSAECQAEGITCPTVEYPDNQKCLDMLQAKGGVINLLDQECAFRLGTDEGFTEKAWGAHGESEYFIKPRSSVADRFGVNHYAAPVTYMTKDWREKNSDTLKDDMREVCNNSGCTFVASLLGEIIEEKSGKTKPTVASKFKGQLEQLKEELNSTDSLFIRTVKPNPQMKPGYLDNGYVSTQLTSAGVMETITMKRAGYPVRQKLRDFWLRYRIIAPKALREKYPPGKHPEDGDDLKEACRAIVGFWTGLKKKFQGKPTFDIGFTKVFSKAEVNEEMEAQRNRKIRRLMPMCMPYLIRWAQAFRKKKEEEERKRIEAQLAIQRAQQEAAERRARGEAAEVDKEKGDMFTALCDLFPHFDLPVVANVTENAPSIEVARSFLLDMQKQRVAEALPTSLRSIFEEAKLRESTQEELIAQGVTTRDKLYALSPDQMSAYGFNKEERDNLVSVLLHQQSEWIVNQRLNLLMGASHSDEASIKRDMEALEQAAKEIKRDLEGHLAGKHMGLNVTIRQARPGRTPPPPEEQVSRFVSMGFTREKAIEALRKSRNDPRKACEILLAAQ